MELEGTIIQRLERQTGVSKAGKEWKKDEYVLETPGTYPHKVKFTIFGDKCDQMQCEVGKSYVLSCDLDSREFNGRWYTDVNVYMVRPVDSAAPAAAAAPSAQQPSFQPAPAPQFGAPEEDNSDDLPF